MEIDVRHIAKLAKLKLEEDRIPDLQRQMQDILNMVENLPEITSGDITVDPLNVMELRPDVICESLDRGELMQNARQKQAGCIVVPRTVTGG